MRRSTTIPVGPTTRVGAGLALAQFVAALVLYLSGDHTAASQTAVEVGASGVLTSLAVIAGRYFQAHKQIGADLEQVEHGLGLTTAQVEALVEQKLPELLPVILSSIGKAVASVPIKGTFVGAQLDPAAKQPGAADEGMGTS